MYKNLLMALLSSTLIAAPVLAQASTEYDTSSFAAGPQGSNIAGYGSQSGTMASGAMQSQGSAGQSGSYWNNGHTVKDINDLGQPATAITNQQTVSPGGMGALQLNPTGTMGLARVFGYGGGSGGAISPGGYVMTSQQMLQGLGMGTTWAAPSSNYNSGTGVGTGASNPLSGGGTVPGVTGSSSPLPTEPAAFPNF